MNAFRILDGKGTAIAINTLDRLAAEFWGVEVSEDAYAKPITREDVNNNNMEYLITPNWFDLLGIKIAEGADYDGLRDQVKEFFGSKELEVFNKLYDGYMNLINHWEELNYKLVKA